MHQVVNQCFVKIIYEPLHKRDSNSQSNNKRNTVTLLSTIQHQIIQNN